MMSVSILFFNVTGIQFWYSDYLEIALEADKYKVNIAFGLVTTTAPVFGVIAGGVLTSCFGGYQNPIASLIALVEVLIAIICGVPLPFVKEFGWFVTCLWF